MSHLAEVYDDFLKSLKELDTAEDMLHRCLVRDTSGNYRDQMAANQEILDDVRETLRKHPHHDLTSGHNPDGGAAKAITEK